MEKTMSIAIIFCLSAIVVGQIIANGAVWLVEKIEKIFSKKIKK